MEIRATAYSSFRSLVFTWYHEGELIDIANDSRYSVSTEQMRTTVVQTLNISSAHETLLGRYEVVVTTIYGNKSDTVELAFTSMLSNNYVGMKELWTYFLLQLWECAHS